MPNISNIFSAIVSFAIGAVMVYSFGHIMTYVINLNTDSLLKMIMLFAWLILVVLTLIYYPIHVLTSEDKLQISQ